MMTERGPVLHMNPQDLELIKQTNFSMIRVDGLPESSQMHKRITLNAMPGLFFLQGQNHFASFAPTAVTCCPYKETQVPQ